MKDLKNNQIKKDFIFNFIYFIFLIFFTLGIGEISYYLISNNSKNDKGKSTFLRNSNIKITRTITGMQKKNKLEVINFRTDSIGSIYPSSLSNKKAKGNYLLFCGGSTTEASQVKEGKRPPDIASQITGLSSINIAKAGQDLNKCIYRIDNFLKKIKNDELPLPHKIFIATSINTLMEFGRTFTNNGNSIKNIFLDLKTPKLIYKFVNYKYRKIFFSSNLSQYEQALLDGCCYGLAEINSKKTGANFLNWESEIIENQYSLYLRESFEKLNNLAKKNAYKNQNIVLLIEPDSFSIPYQKVFRQYWKGIDSRQLMYKFSGKKMSHLESRKTLIKFNKIYSENALEF